MTDELKTLKDLAGDYRKGCFDWWSYYSENHEDFKGMNKNQGLVKLEELKQEAIKWVKHKRNAKVGESDIFMEDDWLKFFNITEADLK